jgi:tetratricopeptide (TPR) repeat protein
MRRWFCLFFLCVGCAHGPRGPAAATPESAASLRSAGLRAEAVGDSVRAEQYFVASLAAGAEPSALTADLVRVCVRAGRLRSALAHAEPELLRHPRDAALAQLVGGLYFALGELGRAEAVLEQALAAAEGSALAHYTLALVLARDPRRSEAVRAHLTRYVALAPSGPHRPRAEHLLAELRRDPRPRRGAVR